MKFDTTYDKLPNNFYSVSTASEFSNPKLLAFNRNLAEILNLGLEQKKQLELALLFSGQKPASNTLPFSQVYAAHQFGNFVPQLGDGRAMVLGEILDPKNRRFDIQLKGSGPTQYSRGGDGFSAIGPVIREYIVSEAMHNLGVPTTRALAAVSTGDKVYRQQEMPGAVFTRVASSLIRIGTFEYFANQNDIEGLKVLLNYSIDRHYPEIRENEETRGHQVDIAILFLRQVMQAQIKLVSKWMSYGFIHGVMNTDNTTITGETIDYGPCAFLDVYTHDKVFSSIDRMGRYAYGNQPKILHWNLARLAEALLPAIDDDRESAVDSLNGVLAEYQDLFKISWLREMLPKFGLSVERPSITECETLVNSWLQHLEVMEYDFTLGFRNLPSLLKGGESAFNFVENTELQDFKLKWKTILREQQVGDENAINRMNSVNPIYIPRNHQIERAIEQATKGEITIFNELNEVLRDPFRECSHLNEYQKAPSKGERVQATFCGT